MTKDGSLVLLGKEIIISEATPKIGNKAANVANTDKTRERLYACNHCGANMRRCG